MVANGAVRSEGNTCRWAKAQVGPESGLGADVLAGSRGPAPVGALPIGGGAGEGSVGRNARPARSPEGCRPGGCPPIRGGHRGGESTP